MKPCPFCGSVNVQQEIAAVLTESADTGELFYGPTNTPTQAVRCYCNHCGAMGPMARPATFIEAAAEARQLWNERTATDAKP